MDNINWPKFFTQKMPAFRNSSSAKMPFSKTAAYNSRTFFSFRVLSRTLSFFLRLNSSILTISQAHYEPLYRDLAILIQVMDSQWYLERHLVKTATMLQKALKRPNT